MRVCAVITVLPEAKVPKTAGLKKAGGEGVFYIGQDTMRNSTDRPR